MKIPGRRIKLQKWIHAGSIVVRVEVEGVIPDAAPGEPCLEPATLRFLDEVQRLATASDFESLAKVGEVFVRRSA